MAEILDQEFAAIVEILKALDPLDPRARVRVLAFVMDQLAIAETEISIQNHTGGKRHGSKSFD